MPSAIVPSWCRRRRRASACAASFETAPERFGSAPKATAFSARKTAGRVQYTKRTGLVNDFVRAFLESRDGSVWIGTDEGVTRWHDGALTNYLQAQGLAYFSVRTIAEDRSGDVWIGTERGVSHWRNGAFVQDAVTARLRKEKIWAIHDDRDGGLWFGTRGAGLFRWRDGKLTEFGAAEGLAASIYQILEDERGTFWMSGPNAILAVSRKDLDRLAEHPGFHPGSDSLWTLRRRGGDADLRRRGAGRLRHRQWRSLVSEQSRPGPHRAHRDASGKSAKGDHRAGAARWPRDADDGAHRGAAGRRETADRLRGHPSCGRRSASGSATCWRTTTTNGPRRIAPARGLLQPAARQIQVPRAGLRNEHAGKRQRSVARDRMAARTSIARPGSWRLAPGLVLAAVFCRLSHPAAGRCIRASAPCWKSATGWRAKCTIP